MPFLSPSPSIHYRRRWFYGLWVTLLLLSAGTAVLWETPKTRSEAGLKVTLRSCNPAPAGTRVQVWVGPKAKRPGVAWVGEGGFVELPLDENKRVTFPVFRVRLGSRRWLKDVYIPRYTWDLVVLKILQPGQPARYFPLSLEGDIRAGLLKAKHQVRYDILVNFDSLPLDVMAPPRRYS